MKWWYRGRVLEPPTRDDELEREHAHRLLDGGKRNSYFPWAMLAPALSGNQSIAGGRVAVGPGAESSEVMQDEFAPATRSGSTMSRL
jgi:hypothetical protein